MKLPIKPLLLVMGASATLYAAVLLWTSDAPLALWTRVLWSPWGALCIALCCTNYVLRGLRWQQWMRQSARPLPTVQALRFYLSGYTFTPTPANVGEAVRGLLVRPPLSAGESLALYGAERLADLLALLLLVIPLVFWWSSLAAWVTPLWHPAALTVSATLLLLALLVCAAGASVWAWRRRGVVLRRAPWLSAALQSLAQRPWHWMSLTLVAWIAQGLATWLICSAMGIQLHPVLACAIYALAMVGGALSLLPAGLGGTEAILTGLLVLFGAPLQEAVAATLLIRVLTLWLAVGLGALALLYSAAVRQDLSLR